LVHPINEESPLVSNSPKHEIESAETELLILYRDLMRVSPIPWFQKPRTRFEEFVYGAKFVAMYHPNETGTGTILELDKLDHFAPAELPNPY